MNLVVIDRNLINLLTKVLRSAQGTPKLRKLDDGSKHRCRSCLVCKVEESIAQIAKTIIKPIVNGCKSLIVYLILEDFKQIYSTLVLDYIRSLYSLTIVLLKPYEQDINIINHEKIDLTILPLTNWLSLLHERNVLIDGEEFNFKDINEYQFLHYDTPYLYKPFYRICSSSSPGFSPNEAGDNQNNTSDCVASFTLTGVPVDHPRNDARYDFDTSSMLTNFRGDEEGSISVGNLDMPTVDCLSDGLSHNGSLYIECFERVMCCGTFDYFHFGHKLLLFTAYISTGNKLDIGITAAGDMLNSKHYPQFIQPLEIRRFSILKYVKLLMKVYGNQLVRNPQNTHNTQPLNYYNCDFFKGFAEETESTGCVSSTSAGALSDLIDGSPSSSADGPIPSITGVPGDHSRSFYTIASSISEQESREGADILYGSNVEAGCSQGNTEDNSLLTRDLRQPISHSFSVEELATLLTTDTNIVNSVPFSNESEEFAEDIDYGTLDLTSDPHYGNLVMDTLVATSGTSSGHKESSCLMDTFSCLSNWCSRMPPQKDGKLCVGVRDLDITVFRLMDVLGPSCYMFERSTMVITTESIGGADNVNEYRRSRQLCEWNSVIIGFVYYPQRLKDELIYPKLSSTFMRLFKNINKY